MKVTCFPEDRSSRLWCSSALVFLNISQFSKEKTYVGVSFNPNLGVLFRGSPWGGSGGGAGR